MDRKKKLSPVPNELLTSESFLTYQANVVLYLPVDHGVCSNSPFTPGGEVQYTSSE